MRKNKTSDQQGLALNDANSHLFENTSFFLLSILSLPFNDVSCFLFNRKGSVLYTWQQNMEKWKWPVSFYRRELPPMLPER